MIAVRTPATRFDEPEGASGHARHHGDSLRQVLLLRAEGGYWVAECPSLPGCIGQGRTRERAIDSVKESIAGYLADLEDRGLPVPEERFDALIVAV
jgi:predicted RNase H-like HicB family nuclease